MRIAYIGPAHGTSLHRARALQRLGYDVSIIDPWVWLPRWRWTGPWLNRAGGVGSNLLLAHRLADAVANLTPDFVWVNQGEWLGPRVLQLVRRVCGSGVPIINYTNDNPFSKRDGQRFRNYLKSVPLYDLLAVSFEENISQARAAGARQVMRVWLAADEIAHKPKPWSQAILEKYRSDVVFVGTWMAGRGAFMADLIKYDVPLSIWGDRWQKASEWPVIAPYWRGPAIYDDDEYAVLIQSAKICLGLLSKGNRNLHTGRSIQIPALGGLLCAERTNEHLQLYDEGREAVFWSDAAECAEQCKALLKDDMRRQRIAAAGHVRAVRNGHYNEQMMSSVIASALETTGTSSSEIIRNMM